MASAKGDKKGRKGGKRGQADYTEAGPVAITRPDGTIETRPGYTPDELTKIVGKPKTVEANIHAPTSAPSGQASLAALIDATHNGTPSGKASTYRLGKAPSSKRGKL